MVCLHTRECLKEILPTAIIRPYGTLPRYHTIPATEVAGYFHRVRNRTRVRKRLKISSVKVIP
jgi:hypothetical protein